MLRCILGVVRGASEGDATIRALARAMGARSLAAAGAIGAVEEEVEAPAADDDDIADDAADRAVVVPVNDYEEEEHEDDELVDVTD